MTDAALDADQSVTITAHEPRALTLEWSDGARHRFDALWLRDQAQGGAFRHAENDQRLFDVADLPADPTIADASIRVDGALALRVEPEGLDLAFDPAWLKAHAYDGRREAAKPAAWPKTGPTTGPKNGPRNEPRNGPKTWDAAVMGAPVWHDYTAVTRDPAALYDWLSAIRRDGVSLMRGAPLEPGTVCRLASLFGYVRETNYGRLFDVRAEAKPTNMAFTGAGLGVHTDNPYRDPVPTLQLLHCLQADPDGGGESLAVDGFEAARRLHERAPEAYALLTRWRVPFRYRGPDVDLQARRPLIDADEAGRPIAVAYNNRSIAPLDLPGDVMGPYYRAYRQFAQILREADLPLRFTLGPGDVFIVDNRRVLHGRGAYGAGARWLQGCYADVDSLLSQLRVMERDREGGMRG